MLETRKALGLVPWPESVELTDGQHSIRACSVVTYAPTTKAMRFAARAVAQTIRKTGKDVELVTAAGKDCSLIVADTAVAPCLVAPIEAEGYALEIGNNIEIAAQTPTGAFYGAQTLAQAIAAGKGILPRCRIIDKPSLAIRGIMADLARLKEKDEYYFKLIDFMSQYKFNTIFLHLTDDQGAPIELKSHPELTSDYALTHDTIRRLVDYAAQRHIDVIPEIEVWGHAGWITKVYPELAEDGPDLCAMNPKAWTLVGELLDEICEMFPSRYFHGGSDEANFGKCPECKAEVEAHGEDALVGLHLKRTVEMIYERGKIPILWGDILLKYPKSADIVPKYAIINHWDYDAGPSDEPVRFLKKKGYTVLGGSGIVFGSRAVLPKGDGLQNVEDFGVIARKHNLLGVNNTIWIPQRYVSDTLWYGIALAAEASWSDGKPDRRGLTASFFKSFFGIDADAEMIEAVNTLHDLPAYVGDFVIGLWRNKQEFDELAGKLAEKEEYLASAAKTLKVLRKNRALALTHKWEYGALVYATRMKHHIGARSAAPGRLLRTLELTMKLETTGRATAAARLLSAQARVLRRLSDQERRLAALTERYWDKWRYKDDPMKDNPFQNTLLAFKSSDGYMLRLADRLGLAAQMLANREATDWEALLAE